jgi:hypothetical protein
MWKRGKNNGKGMEVYQFNNHFININIIILKNLWNQLKFYFYDNFASLV